jgi:hypothetical protein
VDVMGARAGSSPTVSTYVGPCGAFNRISPFAKSSKAA